jgi:hypothetical protein
MPKADNREDRTGTVIKRYKVLRGLYSHRVRSRKVQCPVTTEIQNGVLKIKILY